ncbi:MAG TPA: SDR family NAD(P)-dependent oxidoreductase [Actinomycetota bacterium]|nr:SDR family NAD(P)-dependent oxidoreductase [Actinomycetota bacterium]
MNAVGDLVDRFIESTVVLSFSRVGYATRSRLFDWSPPESFPMDGRVVLVTGGTSGLGLETATILARAGASIRILGRDAARAERAVRVIASAAGRSDVEAYPADLSDLDSVRSVTGRILAREARLDVLIHNAGALMARRRTSAQGFEWSFAAMVLGPFALTEGLLPLLRRGDGGRVILVSSGGMYTQALHLDDLQMEREPYRGSVAYARAKRAQVTLAEAWAERLVPSGVTVHAMHPGWAETPGLAEGLPRFRRVVRPLLRTARQGADTIAWLAASPEPLETSGRFWLDRRPRSTVRVPRTGASSAERERLFEACRRMSSAVREPSRTS